MTDQNKNTSASQNPRPEIQRPKDSWITEPLPESSRPRKDGPGGEDGE